jgi:WD40 repeat protein
MCLICLGWTFKEIKMKRTIIHSLLLAAVLLPLLYFTAQASEPDTIWTIGSQGQCWFSPDGTRILEGYGGCYDVTDGHVIWDNIYSIPNGYFTKDSLYFYSSSYKKWRISDGTLYDSSSVYPEFSTLPKEFADTADGWDRPYLRGCVISDDENIFYCTYEQDLYFSSTNEYLRNIALLCKYDRSLDSIVAYKPIVINGDTNNEFNPSYDIIGFSKTANNVLIRFFRKHKIYSTVEVVYRQFNATTLDSVSEFVYDQEKWGVERAKKLSYNGKFLALGTERGESMLGWIIIYDLTTNSIYKRFLDGDSTTSISTIRFAYSRNDSFLVSAGSSPTTLKIWNYHTSTLIHTYDNKYSYAQSIDVSPDNTKIIVPGPEITTLLRARWTPVTSTEEPDNENETMVLYPNPASDYIEISGSSVILSEAKNFGVSIYDVLGVEVYCSIATPPAPSQEGGKTRFDVSHLSPGVYFVRVGDVVRKFVKI